MKKRLPILLVTGLMAFTMFTATSITVSANSLDDVIGENNSVVQQDNSYNGQLPSVGTNIGTGGNQSIVNGMRDATDLSDPVPQANTINAGIKKIASTAVQVLSYVVVAFLVVRVLIDILYISIPFSRRLLANGHQGQAQGGQQGAGGMSGGMSGGFGGGMSGGFGGGMGSMGGQQQNQQGPGIQWVSNAALNAVATEQSGTKNALKAYAKDMVIVLVVTPIFLVLAVTGTLTNLGFMIGDALVNIISGLGSLV